MRKLSRFIPLLALLAWGVIVVPGLIHLQAQQTGYLNWVNQHDAYVRADFTDANAAGAQNITGLLFYLPANQAGVYRIDCDLNYSQATVVADNFGIQFGVAPTNAIFTGWMFTNATALAAGTPVTVTNNSNNNILTGTPAVTTVLGAHIGGYAEIPSGAADTSVQITVTQSTGANVIVVKRDSGCSWHLVS